MVCSVFMQVMHMWIFHVVGGAIESSSTGIATVGWFGVYLALSASGPNCQILLNKCHCHSSKYYCHLLCHCHLGGHQKNKSAFQKRLLILSKL